MPDDDAEQLRGYVRGYLDQESPEARVREWMESDTGYDPAFWRRSANELGLQGLGISERCGGSGAGLSELGVVFEEFGRALVCAPFFSTVALAATVLNELPDSVQTGAALARIAAGETVATLAWSGRRPATSALRAEDGTITGVADIVIDGSLAQTILVAAGLGSRCGLFLVAPDAVGLTRTALVAMDATRRLSRLEFDAVPAELVAADAGALLERSMDVATLLLAAEQLGGAQRVLESAVNYARTRVQFGRYIGSFQAIKHRCADVLVDVELARSTVYHGLSRAQRDPHTLPLEAALARSVASEAFLHAAGANVQIHGGIGFTWEHSAHLYLKRAKSSALIFGEATMYRRVLAEQLGLAGAPR